MACTYVTYLLPLLLLAVLTYAAPAEQQQQPIEAPRPEAAASDKDLAASEQDDLKPAASAYYGGYGGFGYGGYGRGFGHLGYPYYSSTWGYPGYGYGGYGGYGYGWPYGVGYYGSSYWW